MVKRIPILPMPLDKARSISRRFISIGESLSGMFPSLELELEQADLDFEPREWMALAFLGLIFYFSTLFGLIFVVTIAAKIEIIRSLLVSLSVGVVMGFMSFLYLAMYPKLTVKKKVNEVERNLPHALHHLLIEIRSGIPLYNSLVSISGGKYGRLSQEVSKVVNEINTGKSEIAALEMMAKRNPSLYFRRVLWQIINAMKSGADIGSTISNIVDNLGIEQRTLIKKYGSQLNPLSLMYMIFAVIFPTLGITFLLVVSSFLGIGFDVQWLLLGILAFLFIFQFMMIGLIKSRRPAGI